ncbi:putative bifunctional diguanylate cyclase/phosphodiesterase [Undibacterium sp. TJN25]|uniref:putative bifunctional diguanylate cyclase/phosphodiesterase n=1 Tax=Undibacterium sp. TJN25 TaxID=3413056 RepID=UPI003BEFE1C3
MNSISTLSRSKQPPAAPATIDSEWHDKLIQLNPDAIYVLVDGELIFSNPAGAALLKASDSRQLLGLKPGAFIAPAFLAQAEDMFQGLLQHRIGPSTVIGQCRGLDGSLVNVEIRASRFMHEQQAALQLSVHETGARENRLRGPSAQKTVYEESLLAAAKNPAGHEALNTVALDRPLPSILEDICRRMEKLLGNGAICSIMLLDADDEHLLPGAAPSLPEEYWHAITNAPVGPNSGSCGAAIYHGRPVFSEDIAYDPLWADYREIALKHGLQACWSVPVITAFQTVLGAFAAYYPAPRLPTEAEKNRILDAVDLIALAIDKKRMEQSLAESEERYRSVVTNLTEGIMVVAPGGQILTCNPSAMRILKITDIHSTGRRHRYFKHIINEDGSERKLGDDPASAVFRTRAPIMNLSIGMELRDRSVIWLLVNVMPIIDSARDAVTAVLISFTDTTEVRETQRQLHYMASHDALTGLPNRHQLNQRLSHALANAKRNSHRVAVLFLDLDRFKNVNDTAGHSAGDNLLKDVASRLSSCIRTSDMLARLGGDEFVIVAEAVDNAAHLKEMAERVLARIREPFYIEGNEYYLGTSIGISVFPHDGDDCATLLRCADSAMYYAKESGRNNYQFFTTELNVRAQHRYALEKNLRRALQDQEFLVYYQPKICLKTSRIVGAEALIRWQMPDIGIIMPNEFIPISEEIGLILPIGRWVLEQACKQTQLWRKKFTSDLVVSVNISPRQFQDPGLSKFIEQALEDAGLPAEGLQLEITEGLLMGEVDQLLPVFNAIKALGISISLDDFGTGFSSLSYLQRFPIDNLKIDRSFIRDIPENPDSVVLTNAIIAMANALGMSVTAEGVEKAEQMFFLTDSGCQQMQGYYFSKPVPVEEFEKLLAANAESQH